jgi:probable HAF family extracellular repeat protein
MMTDLGNLGVGGSFAYDSNDLGEVVGRAQRDSKYYHAFLWKDGQMTDLGAIGGFGSSSAEAINNHGVVVGLPAFVYDPQKGMRKLRDLIAPDSGWSGLVPRDINDHGWIVGYGSFDGAGGFYRAFLMIPTAQVPAVGESGNVVMTFLILISGALIVCARGRRGRTARQQGCSKGSHS